MSNIIETGIDYRRINDVKYMRSYLYRLNDDLRYMFNNIDLDNFSEFDIGFSKNEISDFSDPVISLENGEIEQLIISGDVATASSPLYVYWKILSSNNVSASLSIPSALRGEAGELDWMVSLADGSASVASNSGSKAIAVIPESAAFGNIGSAELLISTENVNGGEVLPGEYKGELRLSISID